MVGNVEGEKVCSMDCTIVVPELLGKFPKNKMNVENENIQV